ncbi:MAG: hypothetical protein E7052_06780 [Lentisphaerae bacterium]|nr:hypothetical protein [Lentisphaerota bacterium]
MRRLWGTLVTWFWLLPLWAEDFDSYDYEYSSGGFDFKNYLLTALENGCSMLLAGVVPLIVAALVMQKFSDMLRNRLVGVLGVKGYIYLTAPGVMIHELSHALFCIIFRHQILEMKLFAPEADGTLGYVNHAYNKNSLYQRVGNFFIGTGPIWGGGVMLGIISWWLLPDFMRQGVTIADSFRAFTEGILNWGFWIRWQSWLWLYLSLTIASHITLSPPDLKGAADGLVMIVLVVMLANLLLSWLGNWSEVVWQYEIAILSKLVIASMGALIVGGIAIIVLAFCRKR